MTTENPDIGINKVVGGYNKQQEPKAFNVDVLGNMQSSSIDVSGKQSFNTVFGSAITAKKIDEVLVKFDLGINLELSIPTETNGGTVGESNSRLLLSSSTAVDGLARLESQKVVRYRPGHEMFCYFTAGWLNGGVAGSVQNIGIFDEENGYFVGFNGTDFRISRRKNSVDNDIVQSDFNIDTIDGNGQSKFIIDTSKINIFRITFGYLGIAPAVFEIYGGSNNGWIPFHSIDITNKSAELTIESPNLPIMAEIIKTSGSTDIQMISGSWNGGYYNGGTGFTGDVPFSWNTGLGISLTGVGNESVVAFRLKEIFNGKTNKTRVKNISALFNNDASSDIIKVQIIGNPTTIGGVDPNTLTYTDVATGRSTMEYSENQGVVVGGRVLFTTYLVGGGQGSGAFAGSGELNAELLGLIGTPGDIFTVTYERVTGTGTYKSLTSQNWLELF